MHTYLALEHLLNALLQVVQHSDGRYRDVPLQRVGISRRRRTWGRRRRGAASATSSSGRRGGTPPGLPQPLNGLQHGLRMRACVLAFIPHHHFTTYAAARKHARARKP